ncbi:MAG: DEAD/DEAH box helicase [Burkholderiaceae bacterium]|nr:DEAD/DEAH box helicase [Burkholderiaceae bacterium]
MTTHRSRGYQTDLGREADALWQSGVRNNLIVLPTGAGKTFIAASRIERSGLPTACLAHRNELVAQMSVALAREGVVHNVIGAKTLAPQITRAHMEELGRSFYDPRSAYTVASVQTVARLPDSDPLFTRTRAWFMDEFHHTLRDNQFGKVLARFRPDCLGMGVTATPCRADGKGLGRHSDGVADRMLVGPNMRWLIDSGYLTDYRVIVAPSDIKLDDVRHSASGDFNPEDLRKARTESRITGDAVKQYLKWAAGKLGVVFDVDVASATSTARAFRAAGVPAEVLSGMTDPVVRASILGRFKAREIHVIVSVDIISEGFDLPAIEVVQFARPTESFSLFAQQFGRSLRLMLDPSLMAQWEDLAPARRRELIAASIKPRAIIIDHVGNIVRHGLPDAPRQWTLEGGGAASKGKDPDAIPLRNCLNPECGAPYERFRVACPHCGTEAPPPAERSKPEFVDGDLVELDPATLAALRGEIARIDAPPVLPYGTGYAVQAAVIKRHEARQAVQEDLREHIALWAGWQRHEGRTDREATKLFFLIYGIDTLGAQALGATEAAALTARIAADLTHANVVAA